MYSNRSILSINRLLNLYTGGKMNYKREVTIFHYAMAVAVAAVFAAGAFYISWLCY